MRKKLMAMVTIVSLFGGAVDAATYVCNIKPIGRDFGWISKTLAINVDDKTEDVLVNDAVILHFNKGPLNGRISTSTEKRLTVLWEVKHTKDEKNQGAARFMYRATIYKLTNKIIISGNPSGYSNSFRGAGKCKISQ